MKNQQGEVIGFEKLNYNLAANTNLKISLETVIAEYLDTLSELLTRLDTLQDFAQLCGDRGVKSSKELLPSNDAKPGLYLLEEY